MAKPIETTTAPPHRSPPIDPTPIKTTTDPPNRHRSSTDPSSMTISRGGTLPLCFDRICLLWFRRNVVSRAAELKQVKGCLVFQEQFFVNKSLSRKSGELGALGVMITEHLCVVLSCAVFLW
ncbi:hypothetical protein IGI04_032845 [Brassica rapa subsp. trilocularis]|uniref:Uncharacterized protein n=1 Tax=Brassica rapa subsp. trilocularis TaxID=1813537 RepID=A0ABQ7L478_BRACM|nr:hypothetical protein IGI04_032845 [Brassica rapa subsp. trilocularis]